MNRKGTNCLVAILNIITIVSMYLLAFSTKYLMSSVMTDENGGKSIYGSFIVDTLLNNLPLIMFLVHGGIGIFNIICAIQNKKNKKICFWQLVFGIFEIWSAMSFSIFLDNSDMIEWGNVIIFGVSPILLASINLILVRKNKPKVIQIISYILVMIFAILNLLKTVGGYWNNIVAIVMQFIYVYWQEKDIVESKLRKIFNLILYNILQFILAVSFFAMIIASLLVTKVNQVKWDNELTSLYDKIERLQDNTSKDIYIPVEKDYKYGFINENGEEKIQCQYDRVTYFNKLEINHNTYYVALAKKDNKFYIITKNNDNLVISGDLERYLQSINSHWEDKTIEMFNQDGNYRNAYIQSFQFFFQVLKRGKIKPEQQTIEISNKNHNVL